MIDAAVIPALGSADYLVLVGRGSLIAALREGSLGGAALDVFTTRPTAPERWRDVMNCAHCAPRQDQARTVCRKEPAERVVAEVSVMQA